MSGRYLDGKLSAQINPPKWMRDGFASRVRGEAVKTKTGSEVVLRILPSWIVLGFTILWTGTALFMLIQEVEFSSSSLKLLGIALIPIVLGKLKLNWDRRRLQDWLDTQLRKEEDEGFHQEVHIMSRLIAELRSASNDGLDLIEHMWFPVQEVSKSLSIPKSEVKDRFDRLIKLGCIDVVSTSPLLFQLTEYGRKLKSDKHILELIKNSA